MHFKMTTAQTVLNTMQSHYTWPVSTQCSGYPLLMVLWRLILVKTTGALTVTG